MRVLRFLLLFFMVMLVVVSAKKSKKKKKKKKDDPKECEGFVAKCFVSVVMRLRHTNHLLISFVVCIKVITDIVDKIKKRDNYKKKMKDTTFIEKVIDVRKFDPALSNAHPFSIRQCAILWQ